ALPRLATEDGTLHRAATRVVRRLVVERPAVAEGRGGPPVRGTWPGDVRWGTPRRRGARHATATATAGATRTAATARATATARTAAGAPTRATTGPAAGAPATPRPASATGAAGCTGGRGR